MSKLFDVVRKSKTIQVEDLDLEEIEDQEEACAADSSSPLLQALPTSRKEIRVVRLNLTGAPPIFPFARGDDVAAEQYRIIRTKILHAPNKPQIVLVASGSSGDGKTVTAINVAACLALKEDARILLLDGDLRRPHISDALGLPGSPGLVDVLAGRADLDSVLLRAEQCPNLFILPAGHAADAATELLDSQRWHFLIQEIRERFSNVVIDAPPVAVVADFDLLQVVCDCVIVVARPDHSNKADCLKALATVAQEKLLGVVLNCVENWWCWKTPNDRYYESPNAHRTAYAGAKPDR
jgi:capsular exopolysaccharide synthesis family protein